MEPQLEEWIKSDGKTMDKKKLEVLEKCLQDIKKFRVEKENIKNNVENNTITVDEGCVQSAVMAAKFVEDINEVENQLKN